MVNPGEKHPVRYNFLACLPEVVPMVGVDRREVTMCRIAEPLCRNRKRKENDN